jgi:hypothetical protein
MRRAKPQLRATSSTRPIRRKPWLTASQSSTMNTALTSRAFGRNATDVQPFHALRAALAEDVEKS